MNLRLEAINAVSAKNELLPGLNTSVIRLNVTDLGLTDEIFGRPIKKSFSFSNPIEARVSRINLAMLAEVEKKDGEVGLWLSPPNEIDKRGKILTAVRVGKKVIEYDTTGLTFSSRDFAQFMTSLSPFRRDGYYFLSDKPWKVLESIIPMPLAWQAIRNDQAEMKFNRDVEEALENAEGNVRTYFQAKSGVDIVLACGGGNDSMTLIRKMVSPEGKVSGAEKLFYVKNCGRCGTSIEKHISAGYCCQNCGGVYEGCG